MLKRAEMKPISRPLFALLSALLRPYLKLVYNYSAPKKLPEFPDGPLLFLGSHSSNLDFLFAIPLLRKKRFNAVVASYFYFNERVGRLLNFCRCIRKEQFRTDISSIRDMRAAIKNGGSVLIYPEGEVNGTGRCERPHESIVRLARLLDVPVYAIITHGSYLTRPKWNPAIRRGRAEAEAFPIVRTREELRALSDGELYEKICLALQSNDYDWQEKARVPFPSKAPAEGLEQLLYLCPKCGAERAMKTSGSEIRCAACGNSGHMDEFGFLHPSADEDIIPRTVPEWVDLERDAIRRALASGGFCISAGATLLFLEREGSNKLIDVGHGEMTLDRRAITYRGTRSGEQVSLEFPLDTFVKFPFSMGRKVTFDIPNPERYISIRPDEPEATLKFVLAAPIIKEML